MSNEEGYTGAWKDLERTQPAQVGDKVAVLDGVGLQEVMAHRPTLVEYEDGRLGLQFQ